MMDYESLMYSLDSGSTNIIKAKAAPLYPKFQGMFWIFAEALLITILGLRCVEKGNKTSRILALIGLGFGAVSILLQLLLVWEVFPYLESSGFFSYGLSAMGKLTAFTTMTMIAAIAGALVLRIKEGEKTVNWLKIAAIFSGLGIWVIAMIMIFASDFKYAAKIINLEGIFSACFMISWATAWVLSKMHQKDNGDEAFERRGVIEEVTESVEVEPAVQVEMTQVETAQTEPLQVESTSVEINQMEPLQTEPTPFGLTRVEPTSVELDQVGPAPTEPELGAQPEAEPWAPTQEEADTQQGLPPELGF